MCGNAQLLLILALVTLSKGGFNDCLLIVRETALSSSDAVFHQLLVNEGMNIQVEEDDAYNVTMADGKGFVFVSESVSSSKVTNVFNDVDAQLWTWEGYLFDDICGLDAPTEVVTDSVDVIGDPDPLAAGLTGPTQVYTAAQSIFHTGGDYTNATVIAHIVGQPAAAVFLYFPKGAGMPSGQVAPARRGIFSFMHLDLMTTEGQSLISAIVQTVVTTSCDPADLPTPAPNANNGTCQGVASFADTESCAHACDDGYYQDAGAPLVCSSGSFTGGGVTCAACTPVANCQGNISCSSATDSQCTDCGSDHYADNGGSATVCQACDDVVNCVSAETCTGPGDSQCTDCGASYYLVEGTADTCEACSSLNREDGDATLCGACSAGFFRAGDGNSNSNTACAAHTTCGVGEYTIVVGTTTADRQCGTCSSINRDNSVANTCGPCSTGYTATGGDTDGTTTCVACGGCATTSYEAGDCTRTTQDTCPTCTSINRGDFDGVECDRCDSGYFNSADGNSQGTSVCSAHSTCPGGQYMSSAGTRTSDVGCTACSSLNREAGVDQTECGRCLLGYYTSGGSGPGTTTCTACSTCAATDFPSTACTRTSDTVCSACSTRRREDGNGIQCGPCDADSWRAGNGASAGNNLCSACTTSCADGLTLEGTCGGTTADAYCTECSAIPACVTCTGATCHTCSGGFYVSGGACVECSTEACPSGEYRTLCPAEVATEDSQCLPCPENCAECDPADPLVCLTCDEGHFNNGANCTACTDIPGCLDIPACTDENDSQCTSCASGRYLLNAPIDICDPCTAVAGCDSAITCTADSDSACPACADAHYRTPGPPDTCTACSTIDDDCTNCTATACTACQSPTLLSRDGQACVDACPAGEYAAGPTCALCDDAIAGCADCSPPATTCTACTPPLLLTAEADECVDTCPPGSVPADGGACIEEVGEASSTTGDGSGGALVETDTGGEGGGGGAGIIAGVFVGVCCLVGVCVAGIVAMKKSKKDDDFETEAPKEKDVALVTHREAPPVPPRPSEMELEKPEKEGSAEEEKKGGDDTAVAAVPEATAPAALAAPEAKKARRVGEVYAVSEICLDLSLTITPERWWGQPNLKAWSAPKYQFDGRTGAHYEPLLELMAKYHKAVSNTGATQLAHAVPSSQKQTLVEALVGALPMSTGLTVLKELIEVEIDETKNQATLFRTDSASTKLFRLYATSSGIDYVRSCVGEVVQQCIGEAVAEGELLADESHVDSLANRCQTLLQKVYGSKHSMPAWMLSILHHVYATAEQSYPGSGIQAVGGFFFLRTLAPAVSTPETFFLTSAPPDGPARKFLVDVSKILVALANGVRFKPKQGDLVKLNPLLDYNESELNKFYAALLQLEGDETAIENEPVPSDIVKLNAAAYLHASAVENKNFFAKIPSAADVFDAVGAPSPAAAE